MPIHFFSEWKIRTYDSHSQQHHLLSSISLRTSAYLLGGSSNCFCSPPKYLAFFFHKKPNTFSSFYSTNALHMIIFEDLGVSVILISTTQSYTRSPRDRLNASFLAIQVNIAVIAVLKSPQTKSSFPNMLSLMKPNSLLLIKRQETLLPTSS